MKKEPDVSSCKPGLSPESLLDMDEPLDAILKIYKNPWQLEPPALKKSVSRICCFI